jgi:hypothetical protein
MRNRLFGHLSAALKKELWTARGGRNVESTNHIQLLRTAARRRCEFSAKQI